MTSPTDPLEAAWEALEREMYGDTAQIRRTFAHFRPLIEAATPRPAGVDVERLKEAIRKASGGASFGDAMSSWADLIAREYDALTGSKEPRA